MPVKQPFDTGWSWWSNPLLLLLFLCASLMLKFYCTMCKGLELIDGLLNIAYDMIQQVIAVLPALDGAPSCRYRYRRLKKRCTGKYSWKLRACKNSYYNIHNCKSGNHGRTRARFSDSRIAKHSRYYKAMKSVITVSMVILSSSTHNPTCQEDLFNFDAYEDIISTSNDWFYNLWSTFTRPTPHRTAVRNKGSLVRNITLESVIDDESLLFIDPNEGLISKDPDFLGLINITYPTNCLFGHVLEGLDAIAGVSSWSVIVKKSKNQRSVGPRNPKPGVKSISNKK